MCKQLTECCGQCPYARATPKGYLDAKENKLQKGDMAGMFVGQANGPFALPCHMTPEFEHFRINPQAAPLCAGAAKYRANCGYDKHLPPEVGRLPEDHEAVFSNPAELLAHHHGISIQSAALALAMVPPDILTIIEIQKQHELTFVQKMKAGAN